MNKRSAFLSILGLSAFAIANPILSTLGHGPAFFIAHSATTTDVLLFTACIYLLPALGLTALVLGLAKVGESAGRIALGIVLGLLAGIWAMLFVTNLPTLLAFAIGMLVVVAVTLLSLRSTAIGNLLPFLGAASLLVVVAFLFFSPASRLFGDVDPVATSAGKGSDIPVVFVIFDELSLAFITKADGEIDAERLPNFARLADLSTWYVDTTTVSAFTTKAVTAILTGLRTSEETVPIYQEYPRNLFTAFSASHSISAFESYTNLCPEYICGSDKTDEGGATDFRRIYQDALIIWLHGVLPTALAERVLPSISAQWGNFIKAENAASKPANLGRLRLIKQHRRRDQMQRFVEFVNALDNRDPSLVYLHLGLPHSPSIYFPDGRRYNGRYTPGMSLKHWPADHGIAEHAVLRYALQLEHVDQLLGQTLDVLEKSGRLDETLLVVTSDHGISFTPGTHIRRPVTSTLADIARVPLFIKYPQQKSPVQDRRKVETIDIFPTVLDAADIPLQAPLDGQSLLAEDWRAAPRQILESADLPADFEPLMDMATARERVYRVIDVGVSALNSIGFGAGADLIGQPLATTGTVDTESKLQLFDTNCHDQLAADGNYLPARVAGKVTNSIPGDDIVITINGLVAGSNVVMTAEGMISLLLDPSYFDADSNEMRAFILRDDIPHELAVSCDLSDTKGIGL